MRKAKRMVSLMSAGALCLGPIGCGGDSPTSPTPASVAVAPPAPVQSVVAQGSIGGLDAGFLTVLPSFSSSSAGTLDVTVDWTFASNDVDIYLARGACSFEQFVTNRCNIASFSESVTAKPEKLNVTNAPAGTYTLLIGNHGPTVESLSYQVTLTAVPGAQGRAVAASRAQPSRHRRLAESVRR